MIPINNFLSFIILALIFTITIELQPNKMLVFPMKSTQNLLDKEHFFFILLPQDNNKENITLILDVTFPTHTYTSLDPNDPYMFIPENLCLNCLSHTKSLLGDLYKGIIDIESAKYATERILTKIWIKVERILKNDMIINEGSHYILLTPFIGIKDEVLIMKKIDLLSDSNTFLQVVRATLVITQDQNDVDKNTKYLFDQFTDIPINDHIPMEKKREYGSIMRTSEQLFKSVRFTDVENIICLIGHNFNNLCSGTTLKIINNIKEKKDL